MKTKLPVLPPQRAPRLPQRLGALAALAALATLLAGACTGPGGSPSSTTSAAAAPSATTLDAKGYRIPGGFEPLRAVWLGVDAGHQQLTFDLVRSLQPHARLKMLVNDPARVNEARTSLAARGLSAVDIERIEFHVDRRALYFVRDAAVFALGPRGEPGVIDFRWSHYGHAGWCHVRHADDARRAADCAAGADSSREELDRAIAALAGGRAFRSELVTEGGAVEVNGRGTMIANAAFLQQRNPGRSRAELARLMLELPGIRHIIWLPVGLAEDPVLRATITGDHVAWGTGGHTDEFVRFVDARTVLLAWPEDSDAAAHPVARINAKRMQRNFEILSAATDQDGQRLRVIKLPMPRVVERRIILSAAADPSWSQEWSADYFPPKEGRRDGRPVMQVAVASYLNFLAANGIVLVPGYTQHGTPRAVQDRVQRVFEQAFPGRRIVFIDAIGANWVGGGLHCATLGEPTGSP